MSDRVRRLGTALAAAAVGAGSRPRRSPQPASAAPAGRPGDRHAAERCEPHDVRPDSTVQVTALLRNTSAQTTPAR